jgi:hydroxymethylglutaryl-CoA lyase
MASSQQIQTALANLVPRFPETVIGVHLHSSQSNFQEKLQAALDGGAERIDGALKGIGGCPMAQDHLVGNMDTIAIINFLKLKGLDFKLDEIALLEAIAIADQIFDSTLNA